MLWLQATAGCGIPMVPVSTETTVSLSTEAMTRLHSCLPPISKPMPHPLAAAPIGCANIVARCFSNQHPARPEAAPEHRRASRAAPAQSQSRKGGLSVRAGSTFAPDKQGSLYDLTVKDIDNSDLSLSQYKDKVLLVVNVASQCGFTKQYKELAQLYKKHRDQGFVILAFPCNQFAGQEPGDNETIKKFAQQRGAEFPMMSKVDVNGSNESPVFTYLKQQQPGFGLPMIKWNFSKFLVDREGRVVKRFGSVTTPLSISKDVEALL